MNSDDTLKNQISHKSFGRHEKFHLRTGWLRKGFESIKVSPSYFDREEAIEELGVGKNMIHSIRYWCHALNVIEPCEKGFVQTSFGKTIFLADKYLEDPFSDWLLHYALVTNFKLATAFYWAFNYLSLREFNSDNFIKSLNGLHARLGIKEISESTLLNDYLVFIQTYCNRSNEDKVSDDILDSPFSSLELVVPSQDKRNYRFKIGSKRDLAPELIAYAIAKQMQHKLNNTDALSNFHINLDSLLYEPFSPGMVFKIDGETLIDYLEIICQDRILGNAHFSSTAGIKQLIVNCNNLIPCHIINQYYENTVSK